MGIEEMKTMKTQLMSCIQGQLGDLKNVDAKELGQAVDMVKDLSEAIYYCTITEAMEKGSQQQEKQVNNVNYYTTTPYVMSGKMYPGDYYRDIEREKGYMYYPTGGSSMNMGTGFNDGNSRTSDNTGMDMGMENRNMRGYDTYMPMMRDPREGRAGQRRRMYMEGKEMHKDTNSQLKELEAYLQELSSDITEMIKDASPQERATLHQKMTTLASKIG